MRVCSSLNHFSLPENWSGRAIILSRNMKRNNSVFLQVKLLLCVLTVNVPVVYMVRYVVVLSGFAPSKPLSTSPI